MTRGSRTRRGMASTLGPRRGPMIWIGAALVILVLTVVLLLGLRAWPRSGQAAAASTDQSARQPLFVLGDSFAQNANFQDQIVRAMGDRQVTVNGVGSSSLDEQRLRFQGQINGWKSLLVILDGGLTDPDAVRPVSAIVDLLDRGCGRWLYIEPPHTVEGGPIGSPSYTRQTALVEAVRKRWPDHFVPLIQELRNGAGPSPQDQESVEKGWTPASLRQEDDPLHLNAEGYRILVQTISRAVAKLDASPNRPCSGAAMDQMQAATENP
jgi:hypothetical protein